MIYLYTSCNRLTQPHTYMYSEYGGEDFLRSYTVDRIDRVQSLCRECDKIGFNQENVMRAYDLFQSSFSSEWPFPTPALMGLVGEFHNVPKVEDSKLALSFTDFSVQGTVITSDLMETMIEALLVNERSVDVKFWLDRLIQRFEVTKKLYMGYKPGFRMGRGANNCIYLYEYFALILAMAFARFQSLQHLSTLLKVLDLLLSLPADVLGRGIGQYGFVLVVAVELQGIERLAKNKGVAFNVD